MSGRRKVILYELNEVPWTVLDYYVERNSDSHVARLSRSARCETTMDHEDVHLSPWRTWPSFHKGLPCLEHNSYDLGQDPATFRGDNIWDVAEAAGLRVGLFGPLQSWPPHEPRNGGFYVPDTFSRDAQAFPPSLARFQRFNLAMTQEQGFSSNAPLRPQELVGAGFDLATKGITPWSVAMITRQLVRERRDARYKACRAIFQALPAFDLYWRLHRRHRPDLSIFFTNHVASMMHRYWGDAMPGYASQFDYEPDEVFATFVPSALDVFDHQLGKVMKFVDANEDTVLIVASSMGQEPVPAQTLGDMYVVRDAQRLASVLGLDPVEPGLAMYPSVTLQLPSEDAAAKARVPLESVRTEDGDPMFVDVRVLGRTVQFAVNPDSDVGESGSVTYAANGNGAKPVAIEALGIHAEQRLGGSNTAYHCPDGPMLTYGSEIEPDQSRREVDLFDVAPRILDILGARAN